MDQPLNNVNLHYRYLLRRNYYPSIGIDFKFKLRDVLNTKIEEICTWLDLDDKYTKAFTKPSKKYQPSHTKIIIPTFDLYHKVFGSGTGTERITTTIYEIRTTPERILIFTSILCNASQPTLYPTVQFIP